MIKGVVFDLDHTLFDRYATLRAVLPEMYKRMRDKIPDHLGERDFIENLIKIEKQHIYRGWGYTGEKLVEAGVFLKGTTGEEIWQCIYKHCWPVAAIKYPFTDSVLTDLRAMGLKVGLITNGSVPSQSLKLDMLNLWDFFDEVIICDDETYPAKPDPAAFNDMSKRLNILPNELLYVGDNPLNDVRGAWNSGFIPVWVKTTGIWPEDFEKEADYAVDDVSSVPNLVKEINNI